VIFISSLALSLLEIHLSSLVDFLVKTDIFSLGGARWAATQLTVGSLSEFNLHAGHLIVRFIFNTILHSQEQTVIKTRFFFLST
jgi:hypothetical protein